MHDPVKKINLERMDFVNRIIFGRMGNSEKIKVGRKNFTGDVFGAYTAGGLVTVVECLRTMETETDIDVIRGDLQLIYVHLFNEYNKKFGKGRAVPYRVEDFFEKVEK